MSKRTPLTDEAGEVRELTAEDFQRFRPASEMLPKIFGAERAAEMLAPKKPGRPAGATKVSTTVRFDADVIERFRATGRGWQTRMGAALKDWLKDHDPARL